MSSSSGQSGETEPVLGGAASLDVARITAKQDLGLLPDAAADDPLAFITGVVDYVNRWLSEKKISDISNIRPCVFIFAERPRLAAPRDFTKVNFFAHDASRDIEGRILVSTAGVHEVFEKRVEATDLNALIESVRESGFGARPAVVFRPRERDLILCSGGVDDEETTKRLPLRSESAVDVKTIDQLLSEFYEDYLRTPREWMRLWEPPSSRFVPIANAEKAIHRMLLPLAKRRFSNHIVRSEDETAEGRADISIMRGGDDRGSGSGILELKVLRARYFSEDTTRAKVCPEGDNEQSVVDGMDQVVTYRGLLRCDLAFLCCYDMREQDRNDLLDKYAGDAASRSVESRRYFIYNSAKAARQARPDSVHATRLAGEL